MSTTQVRQRRKPLSSKKLKKALNAKAIREQRLDEMAKKLIATLNRSDSNGFIYGESYEIFLFMVGGQIRLGPEADSAAKRQQALQEYMKGTLDCVPSRDRKDQGERQQLVIDVVDLIVRQGDVMRYDDPDGSMVAIYLPSIGAAPMQAAIHEKEEEIVNYIPSMGELATYLRVEAFIESRDLALDGKFKALLRKWNEQFPIW